jgi:hypothetical protein
VLVGFAAAGNAGNKSAPTLGFLFKAAEEVLREGSGDVCPLAAAEEEEAQGVCPGLAPMRFEEAGGRAGNGLLDDGEDQLAFWLAVDRDDCAVELFSLSTLEPPWAEEPPLSADPVAEPGRDG